MNFTLLTTAIAAGAGAIAGGALAWQIQAGNISEINLKAANERITTARVARATIERTTTAVIKAQNNAAARVVVLRRDADLARGAVDGLRDDLDVTRRAAGTAIDACNKHSATISQLLVASATVNQELAQACDGHVSDITTLVEAWPR